MRYFYAVLLLGFLSGCTSQALKQDSTASKIASASVGVDQSLVVIQTLKASGVITLTQDGSSQSGSFDLKSKRHRNGERIDSLSMVISGPFGITAAKFLGCPGEYCFYNVLEGDKYRGTPDPKALEKLTGMKGLTIGALSNVIYGLAPNEYDLVAGDSVKLFSISETEHQLFYGRNSQSFSEVITLKGKLGGPLKVTRYQRWNKILNYLVTSKLTPDITIHYNGTLSSTAFALPNFITATNAGTKLEIEYQNTTENPNPLTVKIKMPE
jgi:outer membrane biogenesis lipoprotein LolB